MASYMHGGCRVPNTKTQLYLARFMLSYGFKEMDHNLLVSLDGLNLKV